MAARDSTESTLEGVPDRFSPNRLYSPFPEASALVENELLQLQKIGAALHTVLDLLQDDDDRRVEALTCGLLPTNVRWGLYCAAELALNKLDEITEGHQTDGERKQFVPGIAHGLLRRKV